MLNPPRTEYYCKNYYNSSSPGIDCVATMKDNNKTVIKRAVNVAKLITFVIIFVMFFSERVKEYSVILLRIREICRK